MAKAKKKTTKTIINKEWVPSGITSLTIKQVYEYVVACEEQEKYDKFVPLFEEYATTRINQKSHKEEICLKEGVKKSDFATAAAKAFFPTLAGDSAITDMIAKMKKAE